MRPPVGQGGCWVALPRVFCLAVGPAGGGASVCRALGVITVARVLFQSGVGLAVFHEGSVGGGWGEVGVRRPMVVVVNAKRGRPG